MYKQVREAKKNENRELYNIVTKSIYKIKMGLEIVNYY